ncbi:MAG: hypothetical protein WKF34_03485 [Pyrinomonadaceae bacterium]
MKAKLLYVFFAVCMLVGAGFVIGTVSAQRSSSGKQAVGYTKEGLYQGPEGNPGQYTYCVGGTWVEGPAGLYTCRGGTVRGTGALKGESK